MVEVLPIKLLTDEDAQIFGSLNVNLGKLGRAGLPVAAGFVVAPPSFALQTTLNYYDFGTQELFEQNLTLIKKKLNQTPIPEALIKDLSKSNKFLVKDKLVTGVKAVWLLLLENWLEEIKQRLWKEGFSPNLTQGLQAETVFFIKDMSSIGVAYRDENFDEVVIKSQKPFDPKVGKKLDDLIRTCDKKLLIPHRYSWIVDDSPKLVGVYPYVEPDEHEVIQKQPHEIISTDFTEVKRKVATKIYLDMSSSNVLEREIDGVYILGEKVIGEKPQESLDDLIIKLLLVAQGSNDLPILFKLADIAEHTHGVRGTLRLLHQTSLLHTMVEAITFVRNKKGFINLHPVIPFVRSPNELALIKQELSAKKILRKPSLKILAEFAVPENITNTEQYLEVGLDGVVLNLDELISHLYGFDHGVEEVSFYKKEIVGLIKFLEPGLKALHKAKIPVLVYGNMLADTTLLENLIENWVWGVIIEKYEATSIADLLYQVEKKIVVKRSS